MKRRTFLMGGAVAGATTLVAALAIAQPVGDEGTEIDFVELGLNGSGLEEMHLDEFAELVGDAGLIALDDGRMRDRQAERPLEERGDSLPHPAAMV